MESSAMIGKSCRTGTSTSTRAHGAGLKLMAWNVWDKRECGSVASQTAFVPISHEFIFVFGREDKPLNKTRRKKPHARNKVTRIRGRDGLYGKPTKPGDTSGDFVEMTSVASIRIDKTPAHARGNHPAVFPVRLPIEYIKALTDEGELVAEPFSGSGTTIVAAERTGRKCRAMELDPDYCEAAIWRWEGLSGRRAVKIS